MTTDETKTTKELDEYGLEIPVYSKMVLVVIPPRDFAESTLRYTRSKLMHADVGTRVISVQDEELVHGAHQDEFQPEGVLADQEMRDYAGIVFCGGPGALELLEDPDALRLAKEASEQGKPIAAWGHAPALLARAGVLERRRVTSDPSQREVLSGAGAVFTASQVEVDGVLVTADGDTSGLRFAIAFQRLFAS